MLAMDTATAVSSVALLHDDAIIAESTLATSRPGEATVTQIDQALASTEFARADITQLVVGVGPGPYTSTRIGVVIAVSLARALGVPVLAVSSLDAIAFEVVKQGTVADGFGVATDARRREVYWATYDPTGRRLTGPAVAPPQHVLERSPVTTWAGDGFGRYPELVAAHDVARLPQRHPSAAAVARLARTAQAAGQTPPDAPVPLTSHAGDGSHIQHLGLLFPPVPLYLRRPDAVAPPAVVIP